MKNKAYVAIKYMKKKKKYINEIYILVKYNKQMVQQTVNSHTFIKTLL